MRSRAVEIAGARRTLVVAALAALAALAGGACGNPGGGDDGGTADAAVDAPACQPGPRTATPQVLVGPGGLEDQVVAFVDAATTSIDVQMYTFTLDRIADRLIAARNRGLTVRVLLDANQAGAAQTRSRLETGGVAVQWAPSGFPNAHAKYVRADDRALILSGNFTVAGMVDQRNYAVIDRDGDDVADLGTVFAADWAGQPAALGCTRLVVSPGDARARVLSMIGAAAATLELELYYLSDSAVRSAVISAHGRGVAVRVLLADPSDMSENVGTADTLAGAGLPVRVLATPDVHAKLVVADGVALIGSHNMSSTSLRDNREVGVLVDEATPAAVARSQFEQDWAAARPW